MCSNDFLSCHVDSYFYFKKHGNFSVILILYVNCKGCTFEINKLKRQLSKEFSMKDSGVL